MEKHVGRQFSWQAAELFLREGNSLEDMAIKGRSGSLYA